MPETTTKKLVYTAMIAAIYTALCLALAQLSFGPVQLRVAEALTLLPVLSPIGIWGVTLGCALSNLVGFFTGANILGFMDIPFGTAATLLAALASHALRNLRWKGLPLLAALPPILFNALIIGAELAYMLGGRENFSQFFLINAAQVGAGQLIPCLVLGPALVVLLERSGAARVCFGAGAAPRQL